MYSKTKEQQKHFEDLQRLQNFRLMDDEFMTACFEGQPQCIELILRIILSDPKLIVENLKIQHTVKNLMNHSVIFDVYAVDGNGRRFNVEIQRSDRGASVKRARYHGSMIDGKILNPGKDFDDLPDTYVIFITENDVLGRGEPLYHVERAILESGELFNDGSHIIYVNGKYRGDTPLGRLMQDLHCTDAADMYYNELSERVRFFKETEKGVATMSKVIEEMRMEERLEERSRIIDAMLRKGLSIEEIAEMIDLPLEEVKKMAV